LLDRWLISFLIIWILSRDCSAAAEIMFMLWIIRPITGLLLCCISYEISSSVLYSNCL